MNPTVTEILLREHGVEAAARSKIECPTCRHHTFSIKADNSIGTCFHPTCGFQILPRSFTSEAVGTAEALRDVYTLCHEEFLQGKDHTTPSPYSYCHRDRKIHRTVLAHSMLGAVPSNFATLIQGIFLPHIEEVSKRIADLNSKKGKGKRRTQKELETLEQTLGNLERARDSLIEVSEGKAGWLMFFYQDACYRIVAIRFRQPNVTKIKKEKKSRLFKPFKTMGVFNACLFSSVDPAHKNPLDKQLLVTEGEFNTLRVQSLAVTNAEAVGEEPTDAFIFSCAVGGVRNADPKTITRLSSDLYVCYDNDADGAGETLVKALQQHKSVRAFTTPGTDTDLDSFIDGYGVDVDGAWKALKLLVQNAEIRLRPFDAVRGDIDTIRSHEGGDEGLKTFQVSRKSFEKIAGDLVERGSFKRDGQRSFYFLEEESRLYDLMAGGQDLDLLLQRYGVNPTERLHSYLRAELAMHGLTHCTPAKVHVFSHYDADSGILYVHDHGSGIYRIDGKTIEHSPNGTDGVLFVSQASAESFSIAAERPSTTFLQDTLIQRIPFIEGDGAPAVVDQRHLLLLWMLSLYFPELHITRPIVVITGEKGSGKTTALRLLGKLLHGTSFNVTSVSRDLKDAEAAITSERLVVFDNTETPVKGFEDLLATASTGQNIKRRALFTTNTMVEFPVTASLALTTQSLVYRRADVLDRTLLFRVTRLEAFRSERQLLAEVSRRRQVLPVQLSEANTVTLGEGFSAFPFPARTTTEGKGKPGAAPLPSPQGGEADGGRGRHRMPAAQACARGTHARERRSRAARVGAFGPGPYVPRVA